MNLLIDGGEPGLTPKTTLLQRRMLCPFTGLSQQIGFMSRGHLEPRIEVAGGELTGVHLLLGLPPPSPGAYHIGGSGVTHHEALIGLLGETIERYAQYAAIAGGCHSFTAASYREMITSSRSVLVPASLRYFSERQLARPRFPFRQLLPDTVIGWIAVRSLLTGAQHFVPAQLALVGYKRMPDEPQFMIGVTTGTAAHTRAELALRNALLELIQIDAAMGHWYGNRLAVLIRPGLRTRAVETLIARALRSPGPRPRYVWLPSADLPGFTVACILEGSEAPLFAAGLGCDLRLSRAIYKAFLEAVAVAQLAKVVLFRHAMEDPPRRVEADHIFDLDSNVAYYAARPAEILRTKFSGASSEQADRLPSDRDCGAVGDIRYMIDAFQRTHKELVFLDLTTSDIRELGFHVVRVWSPDTISLPLPSAPPLLHPRFSAYGGVTNEAPHPYP